MYETELWRRAACTADEKKRIMPVIEILAGLAEKAAREGMLALEDDLPGIESPFIRKGLGLVVDGTDPELVKGILLTWIYAGEFSGSELLVRMMATDGILSIQQGAPLHVLREILYAYLGEDCRPAEREVRIEAAAESGAEAESAESADESRPDEGAVFRENADTPEDERCMRELMSILEANGRVLSGTPVSEEEIRALSDAVRSSSGGVRTLTGILGSQPSWLRSRMLAGFEAHDAELYASIMKSWIIFDDLAGCSDRDIQKILREVDTADLTKALKGASPQMSEKIFRNMSNRAAFLLREDMEYMGPVRVEDVEDSQNRIVRIARMLQEAGDIIIARPGERLI